MFNMNGIVGALLRSSSSPSATKILGAQMFGGTSGARFQGSALRLGALAALGGLAFQAWQRHQQLQADDAGPVVTPTDRFVPPEGTTEHDDLGKSLVRAMIAAAKADRRIDADEKDRIFAKLETLPLGPAEKAFVFDELDSPLDLGAVVAGADTEEHAVEIYAASLVAIDADTPEERSYLTRLARRLDLEPGLVNEIHRAAGLAPLPLDREG